MEKGLITSAKQLKLTAISTNQGKEIIVRHHYLRTWPVGVVVCYGVTFQDKVYGVICFARGASPKLWRLLGASSQYACVELVRLWLSDVCPKNSESRVIAIALRMLFIANPHIEVVGAYADTVAGHVGTVYKASGWEFVRKTTGGDKSLLMQDGTVMHKRSVNSKYGSLRNAPIVRYTGAGSSKLLYRYYNTKKRLLSGAIGYHPVAGSATLTQPLQNEEMARNGPR